MFKRIKNLFKCDHQKDIELRLRKEMLRIRKIVVDAVDKELRKIEKELKDRL
jgi:hypothetical protein